MRHPTSCLLTCLLLLLAACGDRDAERSTAASPTTAAPRIVTRSIAYRDGDLELEGFLAYDDARKDKRPGVVVIHEWWGLGAHAKERAERLAALGYVAFCADMYGKGKLTQAFEEANAWSSEVYADTRGLGMRRANLALDVLRSQPQVDASRIAAIGFCFGGTLVLEWAWSGADLKAVVSFHGNPKLPTAEDLPGIRAAVLVCHGAEDPFVQNSVVDTLEEFLRGTALEWALVKYSGARHSFTNKDIDALGIDGAKYHASADLRSWEHMRSLLAERFGE